jgi:hypothetical protein
MMLDTTSRNTTGKTARVILRYIFLTKLPSGPTRWTRSTGGLADQSNHLTGSPNKGIFHKFLLRTLAITNRATGNYLLLHGLPHKILHEYGIGFPTVLYVLTLKEQSVKFKRALHIRYRRNVWVGKLVRTSRIGCSWLR